MLLVSRVQSGRLRQFYLQNKRFMCNIDEYNNSNQCIFASTPSLRDFMMAILQVHRPAYGNRLSYSESLKELKHGIRVV